MVQEEEEEEAVGQYVPEEECGRRGQELVPAGRSVYRLWAKEEEEEEEEAEEGRRAVGREASLPWRGWVADLAVWTLPLCPTHQAYHCVVTCL